MGKMILGQNIVFWEGMKWSSKLRWILALLYIKLGKKLGLLTGDQYPWR